MLRLAIKRSVLGMALVLVTAYEGGMTRADGSASNLAEERAEMERPPDPAVLRAVVKICRKGGCQRTGRVSYVQVWRNEQGKVRLLEYNGTGCFHAHVTYHDPAGKFLVAQTSGPRDPEEWDSPDDRKIRKLHTGLSEAEYYACGTKTARFRARESSREAE
jgi:hypothetical protein